LIDVTSSLLLQIKTTLENSFRARVEVTQTIEALGLKVLLDFPLNDFEKGSLEYFLR
jgi:hypothetical protein